LLDLDNPFWRFSLSLYGSDGVKEECIALQDVLHINVNALLFAAWLGAERGAVLTAQDFATIQGETGPWSTAVVQPLRQARRYLKPLRAQCQVYEDLARTAGRMELDAEQVEQALLFALAESRWPASRLPGSTHAARTNVEAAIDQLCAVAHPRPAGAHLPSNLIRALAAKSSKGEVSDNRQDGGKTDE
jgi:uncharacterized protein (TIGR02444 family)